MTARADYFSLASDVVQLLIRQETVLLQQFKDDPELGVELLELIKLRVSQINQCAFCIDMHSTEAQKRGETSERIIGLSAWRDMPIYSRRERLALNWAELLTSGQSIDDAAYQQMLVSFSEQAMVYITLAVNAINSWNRVAKTFKPEVGSYK